MQIIGLIEDALRSGSTRMTFELLPPLKGQSPQGVFDAIDTLAEFNPAYINVTFQREGVQYVPREDGLLEKRTVRNRPGTVGISAAIMKRYGIEVVQHLICGGMSRYDIEDALIDLDLLGIDNILALRGDAARGEQRFTANSQGWEHADQLVRQITDMNRGHFLDDETQHDYRTHFCVGVAGYPEKHAEAANMETDIANLRRKVDAGASYIVTQLCFDNAKIFSFINSCCKAGITVPIIPGIKPLSTARHLNILPQTFHVDIPQPLVQEVSRCKTAEQIRQAGIEWAIMQARELKAAGLPVIHFYTMGKADGVAEIVKAVF